MFQHTILRRVRCLNASGGSAGKILDGVLLRRGVRSSSPGLPDLQANLNLKAKFAAHVRTNCSQTIPQGYLDGHHFTLTCSKGKLGESW
jgi:hypothetical protein